MRAIINFFSLSFQSLFCKSISWGGEKREVEEEEEEGGIYCFIWRHVVPGFFSWRRSANVLTAGPFPNFVLSPSKDSKKMTNFGVVGTCCCAHSWSSRSKKKNEWHANDPGFWHHSTSLGCLFGGREGGLWHQTVFLLLLLLHLEDKQTTSA